MIEVRIGASCNSQLAAGPSPYPPVTPIVPSVKDCRRASPRSVSRAGRRGASRPYSHASPAPATDPTCSGSERAFNDLQCRAVLTCIPVAPSIWLPTAALVASSLWWSRNQKIAGREGFRVAKGQGLSGFGGSLYAAWKGASGDDRLEILRHSTQGAWQGSNTIPGYPPRALRRQHHQAVISCMQCGRASTATRDCSIWCSTGPGGRTRSALGGNSDAGPALAFDANGTLFAVWMASGDSALVRPVPRRRGCQLSSIFVFLVARLHH